MTDAAALHALLVRAHAGLDRALAPVLAAHGLTPAQFELLSLLAREGPTTALQAAAALGVAPGNVTCVTDNMARDGLLEKAREVRDRRRVRLAASPEGLRRLEALMPEYEAAREAFSAGLTEDERFILTRLLRKLGGSRGDERV